MSWKQAVQAFINVCKEYEIHAALERSRSGNGAHVWIFFAEEVQASKARKLGSVLLSRTMEQYFELGIDSFDRLFPNQDTLPEGGLGNLIALPLQGESRKRGNSIFLDSQFQPIADQWQYLSGLRKISLEKINHVIKNSNSNPLVRQGTVKDCPKEITITLKDGIFLDQKDLLAFVLKKCMDLADFNNPAFYKAHAKKMIYSSNSKSH